MPIPKPNSGESQNEFVSRCVSQLYPSDYDQRQAVAICINTYETGTTGLSTEARVALKIKGINLLAGLDGACWEGYEAIGTKIVDGREVPNCVPIKDK
jgi:hypothetical protein